jgi:hypothetical protein
MVAVKDFLGIPQEKLVRTIISIGYPNEDAQRARTSPGQARKPLRDLVHYDRY